MPKFAHTSVKVLTRRFLLGAAVAAILAIPAGSAQATTCTTNAIGIAHSNGVADHGATTACAPANGEPADAGTGHKVG